MALVLAVALLVVEADMPRRKSQTVQPQPAWIDPSTLCLVQTLNPHAAGIDLGAMLVAEGFALADPTQSYDYFSAEAAARQLRRGLWQYR